MTHTDQRKKARNVNFTPRLDILPPPQRVVWPELSATPENFILYGGTALALHLGHRNSIDFDFFSLTPINPVSLRSAIPYLENAVTLRMEENTLTCQIDRGGPVKISFLGLPNLRQIQKPVIAPKTGVKIASLLDIAGTKAQVVQARGSAKDYIDIDALITLAKIPLAQHLAAARIVYGQQFEPLITLKALTYFEDVQKLPLDVQRRLIESAANTDPDDLPMLTVEEYA